MLKNTLLNLFSDSYPHSFSISCWRMRLAYVHNDKQHNLKNYYWKTKSNTPAASYLS
jgi:hypothetical protein